MAVTTTPPTTTTTDGARATATHHLLFVGKPPPDRCLDVPSGPGTTAQLSLCGPAVTMDWQYITSTKQIRGGGGDYCLALAGPHRDGGLVTMARCDHSDRQTWSREGQTLHNLAWGCLDPDGNGDDKTVQISDCVGDPDQLWHFAE